MLSSRSLLYIIRVRDRWMIPSEIRSDRVVYHHRPWWPQAPCPQGPQAPCPQTPCPTQPAPGMTAPAEDGPTWMDPEGPTTVAPWSTAPCPSHHCNHNKGSSWNYRKERETFPEEVINSLQLNHSHFSAIELKLFRWKTGWVFHAK